jgi:type I restriction enzyme, S subunit
MRSEISEGWINTNLENICTSPQYGWTSSAEKNKKGLRFLRTTDISGGGVNWSTVPGCAEEPGDPKKYLLLAGDIVISRAGSVGVSFLVNDCPPAIFASYLIRFRPRHPIEGKYISLFLNSPEYWAAIADETAGIAVPNVNATKLKGIKIPLPPIAEQKRIVANVEELLGRVNSVRERLARVQAILKRFRQSVLSAACSGRLTADWRQSHPLMGSSRGLLERIHEEKKRKWFDKAPQKNRESKSIKYPPITEPNPEFETEFPESWCLASMDELTSHVTSGSRDWKRYYRGEGPGTFIMAQNVKAMLFDRSFRLAVDPPKNDRDRRRSEVKKNDILVTIAGNTGEVCRIKEPVEQHYVCQSVALMRPAIGEISPYLEIYLNSPKHGQAQYRKWIYGEGRPHLSFEHLRTTAVAVPPLEEQQLISFW